ncbi:hypothetical protein V5799_025672 [Amblyomma americanum]|uniref:Uncharacterized protein n=1 Tax=Amblyomma americanum TaxID=6943 RepID=A0AAQ4E8U9_AMBAM
MPEKSEFCGFRLSSRTNSLSKARQPLRARPEQSLNRAGRFKVASSPQHDHQGLYAKSGALVRRNFRFKRNSVQRQRHRTVSFSDAVNYPGITATSRAVLPALLSGLGQEWTTQINKFKNIKVSKQDTGR